MRNSARLCAIASLVDNAKIVADIGTDHGYLAKILLENNKAQKVIATDISQPSLNKAIDLAKTNNFGNRFEGRVGDGLSPLKDEKVDVIVIAGMGAREIIKIISNRKVNARLILQPAQDTILLRNYLIDNNFKIIKDFIVKDRNKFYNTLEVEYSLAKQSLSDDEKRFGLTNFDLRSTDFKEYLLYRKDQILKTLETNKSKTLEEELKQIERVYSRLY